MNCDKSENFMQKWQTDSLKMKRKLTEFSLQLTPTKFADMINYKKVLLDNLSPSDIELTIKSDGKEIYSLISDSKMKSLCLKYAKELITKLEFSAKNEDVAKKEENHVLLNEFMSNLKIQTTAYGTSVTFKKDLGKCNIICNDASICQINNTQDMSFDVLTFNQGHIHTFVIRVEFENGDMYSFYSAIGRDGSKGEKPKIYASCFVDGYYISKNVENIDIY